MASKEENATSSTDSNTEVVDTHAGDGIEGDENVVHAAEHLALASEETKVSKNRFMRWVPMLIGIKTARPLITSHRNKQTQVYQLCTLLHHPRFGHVLRSLLCVLRR